MSSVVVRADNGKVAVNRAAAVGLLAQCEQLALALRAALEVPEGEPLPISLAARLRYRFTRPDGLTVVGGYVLLDCEEEAR